MQKDRLIELARKVGFAIDKLEARTFEFEAIGFKCVAFMYFDRQANEVISLQLFCGFENQPDPRLVDQWNRNMRFVKAYTSPHGKLILEMDLIVPEEMTAEHLKDAWRIWNQLLARASPIFAD